MHDNHEHLFIPVAIVRNCGMVNVIACTIYCGVAARSTDSKRKRQAPPVNAPAAHRTALCRAGHSAAPNSVELNTRSSRQPADVMELYVFYERAAPPIAPPVAAVIQPPPPRHSREARPMHR